MRSFLYYLFIKSVTLSAKASVWKTQVCKCTYGFSWLLLEFKSRTVPDLKIGDDGTLSSFAKGKAAHFGYIIYSQGFSVATCHKIKQIIEDATGLKLSTTAASGEYGVRLTIFDADQIKLISKMIGPYLSRVEGDSFWKKYDLERHLQRLSLSTGNNLMLAGPKNYWTEPELVIVEKGVADGLPLYLIHRCLLNAGFKRTYYATYYKLRQITDAG